MTLAATLLIELDYLLAPLAAAAGGQEQPDDFLDFLADAYVEGDELLLVDKVADLAKSIDVAIKALAGPLAKLRSGSVDPADIANAVKAGKAVFDALKAIKAIGKPDTDPSRTAAAAERVIDHLVGIYLTGRVPRVAAALVLLRLLEEPDPVAKHSWRVNLQRLADWAENPAQVQRDVIGWGTPQFDHKLWTRRLAGLAEALGLEVEAEEDAPTLLDLALVQQDPLPLTVAASLLLVEIIDPTVPGNSARVELLLEGLPATQAGSDGGIALSAPKVLTGKKTYPLEGSGYEITFDIEGEIGPGTFLSVRPDDARIITPTGPGGATTGLTIIADAAQPGAGQAIDAAPLAITLGKPRFEALLEVKAGQAGVSAEADLSIALPGSTFGLETKGGDSFVTSVMTALPQAKLDLLFGFNTRSGLYFDADGGLSYRAVLLPHPDLPAAIEALTLALRPRTGGLALETGLDVSARIGPLFARIEGVGAVFPLDLADPTKLFELAAEFRNPTGLAFALDFPSVKGGGSLSRDPTTGRYSGALELQLPAFGLHAFGLLDTTGAGYSLLLFVGSRFSPIPIGFGFTLNGVGGLIGLHRDLDVEALFAAVRTGAARRLLAPENPVRDAQALIAEAAAIFPPRRGQHVFGPTVKLGWGSPKQLVSLDLALAITLPEPLRIILIGTLRAALPDEKVPLLKLNVDVAGVLDLSASRFDMEGRIYDSAIQAIPIEGGFALRSSWGRHPEFALSVGGLHPAFEPPPGFPHLPRLAADLSRSKNFQLRLAGYFAVTSNSIQLGARVDLKASAAGFGVEADLSFDALLQFEPFRLDLQIAAGAAIKRGRKTIASLRLTGRLRGPGPWTVNGTATLEVLFVDVDIRVSKSFGHASDPLPATTDLRALQIDALTRASSWSAAAGARVPGLVLGDLGANVLPDAPLRVSQQVAPLAQRIELAGGRPLRSPFETRIAAVEVGGVSWPPTQAVLQPFAPAQFIDMADSEKLSAPAFEDCPAGALFESANLTQDGPAEIAPTGPEFIVIDAAPRPSLERLRPPPSGLSRRSAPPAPRGRIGVRSEGWRAEGAGAGGERRSWTQVRQGGGVPVRAGEAS